jgi:hypothetical protein
MEHRSMSDNKNKFKHPERDSKAIKIFTKVKSKRKGKFIGNPDKVDPRLDEHDVHEQKLEQLNRDAVKFLHLPGEEIERREFGYSVGGGLHPDYYQGG